MESKRTDEQNRLNSGILSTALLDEIAGRLLNLEKMQKSGIPEGLVEPILNYTVDQTKKTIHRTKPWMGLSITNDGPADVYCLINTTLNVDPHIIISGEVYTIDFKHPKIHDIVLWTDSGLTSTVRMVGTR